MSKLPREIVTIGLEDRIAAGVQAMYDVAVASYGPSAGNALLELQYGDPLVSRDGVTNVEKVFLEDSVANAAAALIKQASKKNNRKVGDGTTAVVILAYHLYKQAMQMIAAGNNRMEVSRKLEYNAIGILAEIDRLKMEVTPKMLEHVAKVSAGDESIGLMVADVISEVGIDGGVTVEDFPGIGIYSDIVDGFYFRKGFTSVNLITDPTNLESKHENADIFISEKKMNTTGDIAPILEKIITAGGKGKELILVGEVSEEVLGVLMLNRMHGIISVTPVELPIFGAMRSLALEDLALVTGAKVYVSGANPGDFDISMLGGAKKVTINEFSTTIIEGEGPSEDVEARITELHTQLSEAESTVTSGALKDRLSRLTGKIAIIRVGGATEVEQKEVKLRVEDAVCAVQAAIKEGIVPGGGTTLARLGAQYGQPLVEPFLQLVENAGYNSDRALWRLLAEPMPYGYDLKKDISAYKPIDLIKAGIIDPASVVKEVVQNATSVVAKLITISVGVMYADREQKHD